MATFGRTPTPPNDPPLPLSRKDFFDLSVQLREWAAELALLDPRRVNLPQCHKFNGWLQHVRRYAPLQTRLASMKGARPVARWQVVTLVAVAWAIIILALMGRAERFVTLVLLNSAALTFLFAFLVPQSLYGTTVEQIEGKLLRVVVALEEMLVANEPGFTEAVYFATRDNLAEARRELRLQIDLAHRD
jgi:hypothetical protein